MTRTYTQAELDAAVAAALEEASYALMECAVWCDSQEYVDDGWRNGVADARRHISRHIRALIPDAGAALDRALEQAREEGRREEREACAKLAHDLQVSADQINDAYAAKRLPGVFLEPDGYEIAAAIRARAAELKENQ